MAFTITLAGSKNLISSSQPNRYSINCIESIDWSKYKVGLTSMSMTYCWANINVVNASIVSMQTNGNFSYIWPNGAGFTTYSCTPPNNSFWEVSDLNLFLRQQMLSNLTYLIDSNGNPVYYISIAVNSATLGCQVNIDPLPTSLGTYTQPAGAAWSLPSVKTTPQLVVPGTIAAGYNNGTFGSFLGFASGTFPSSVQTTAYSAISTYVPTVSPISTVYVQTNVCMNRYNQQSNVVYTLTGVNTAFGALIVENPNNTAVFYDCNGFSNNLTVTFVDQNFNILQILDPASVNVVLTFMPK